MKNKPVYVTQPSLPPLEEYIELLQEVWESGILTHNGPMVQRMEQELCNKLSIDHFVAVTNGTVAIQMAIKAMELQGEIITTPFSWIATISAIKWEGCTPVFCDIDAETLNIDPKKIEALISDKTVAIMPVHVFGNPCDIDAIKKIAAQHHLKIIYDAAHAIGSTYNKNSVLIYGDISATSLHGTKLINTAEGGGCITNNSMLYEKLKRIRFFGHNDDKNIVEDGFNGKMTEVHASLGIANLKYYDSVLEDRKAKYLYYKKHLSQIKSLKFQAVKFGESNYSYFSVIFESEEILLTIIQHLNRYEIYPRRYFYPSLNTFNKVINYTQMPVSEDISKRILCLPLYFRLNYKKIDEIVNIIYKGLLK